MALRQYDPKSVLITFGPILVSGFAEGAFLTVEQAADTYSSRAGADGEVVRSRSRDERGVITVTLLAGVPANALLAQQHELDKSLPAGAGCLPLLIKDLGGTSLWLAEKAWIVRAPNAGFGASAEDLEWKFETDRLVGGSGLSL